MNELTDRQKKDVQVLRSFMHLYCAAKHGTRAKTGKQTTLPPDLNHAGDEPLCDNCMDLLSYAVERRRKCPLDPKPSCKNCPVHCYGKEHRAKIREVMAFSGKRMILRGRLDLLWHYLF
jgi:hypothetical protein